MLQGGCYICIYIAHSLFTNASFEIPMPTLQVPSIPHFPDGVSLILATHNGINQQQKFIFLILSWKVQKVYPYLDILQCASVRLVCSLVCGKCPAMARVSVRVQRCVKLEMKEGSLETWPSMHRKKIWSPANIRSFHCALETCVCQVGLKIFFSANFTKVVWNLSDIELTMNTKRTGC